MWCEATGRGKAYSLCYYQAVDSKYFYFGRPFTYLLEECGQVRTYALMVPWRDAALGPLGRITYAPTAAGTMNVSA